MAKYEKYECVPCGYQFASRAKDPRCPIKQCSSRRLNKIEKFTTNKPHTKKPISAEDLKRGNAVVDAKDVPAALDQIKKEIDKKPTKAEPEMDDVDKDFWG